MSYKHLAKEERYQIYALRGAGWTLRAIGASLGRDPGTICRELRRNRGGRGYRPEQADGLAAERARESRCRVRIKDRQWRVIAGLIRHDWSPEQISNRARREGTLRISPEWIYQFIYADRWLGGDLWRHLRCRARYRKRYGSGRQRRGALAGRVGIEHRPAGVDERREIGHWEADTIIGAGHRGAGLTMVERVSRFMRLGKLTRRTAQVTRHAFWRRLGSLADRVKTLTVDNGKEFGDHIYIADDLNSEVYFADPYASYQRGTNENTNGLVRQYLPKDRDLSTLSGPEIRMIENRLNKRPRKCLQYLTPHEVFYDTSLELTVALRD